MGNMAASPVSFFLLLMATTFVVPFIVAIRMPNLRSLLTFALVIGAVQFTLAVIAVQFADTALLKDEAQVFARFFLWSAFGLGSTAGAVFRVDMACASGAALPPAGECALRWPILAKLASRQR